MGFLWTYTVLLEVGAGYLCFANLVESEIWKVKLKSFLEVAVTWSGLHSTKND